MREITMEQPVSSMAGRRVAALRDPLVLTITVLTLAALALRMFYLLHDGFLLSAAEYDDGPYFGSAVRLTQGVLPYRDFVLVQPPGITLLMIPSALLAKVAGTAAGMASGRVLTVLAGTASVPLTGLLVRHRGVLATVAACGLMAVYPDAVAATHTVLVEPWLVLFTLLGTLLLFDGDHVAVRPRRLLGAGVALGLAATVEAWAIVPVAVVLVICLADPRPGRSWPGQPQPGRLSRPASFAAGVVAGFVLPVAPFAAASPSGFYRSLVVAQIGPRRDVVRVGLLDRLYELTGLSDLSVIPGTLRAQLDVLFLHTSWPVTVVVWGVTALLILVVTGLPAWLIIARTHVLTPLEWFALASTWLVVAMFLWPSQFYYHFAAFLTPFLALAIALPLARLCTPAAPSAHGRLLRTGAPAAAALLITVFAVIQARTEGGLSPGVPAQPIAAVDRIIPAGSCVVSDSVSLLLLADRFNSSVPGCTIIDDGLGTDLALSHGLTPETGAAAVPAVARLWHESFSHAQFLWLSSRYTRRIPFSPALQQYMNRHFKLISADNYGDKLYRRVPPSRPALTNASSEGR